MKALSYLFLISALSAVTTTELRGDCCVDGYFYLGIGLKCPDEPRCDKNIKCVSDAGFYCNCSNGENFCSCANGGCSKATKNEARN